MASAALASLAQVAPRIGGLDWGLVAIFLVVGTGLAIAVRGRQDGVRDFFLSNRNLPWTLVCASLIATEISAASFLGVPLLAYQGSLIYLQLAIGTIIARVLVGYLLIPAFYEQPLSSPYHFIGTRLGLGPERMTRGLFVIGTVLGQAVRVFMVAIAIRVITGLQVEWTIFVITVFAALWALIGGIRTVVWTDLLALLVIVAAGVAAAVYVISQTTGGLGEVIQQASDAKKLKFFDFDLDLVLTFTIWTGLLGSTFNTLASHGVDHMNTQRLFCCRSGRDARRAVIGSALSQLFVILMILVGLGLFAYYQQNASDRDTQVFYFGASNILAIFVGTVMPTGLKGLLVIGLLAAAISSLNSALAALAHVTSRSLYRDGNDGADPPDKSRVAQAQLLTVIWAVVLGLAALYFNYMVLLDVVVGTALKVTSFTYGALLGAMLLALMLKKRDGRGLLFALPLAVLTAFGLGLSPAGWTYWFIIAGVTMVAIGWLYAMSHEVEELLTIADDRQYTRRAWYLLLAEFPRTIWILAGIALVLYVHFFRVDASGGDGPAAIAWPWYLPVGTGVTIALGYLLSRPRSERDSA
jgi:SSS family solute:Na+ symporter